MKIEDIKKRVEEIKSYDYSWVERYINEKTRFDGTAIHDHKKELVGSVEYLLSIIEHHNEGWKAISQTPMSMHPSEVREFGKEMLKGNRPYILQGDE